MAAFLLVQAGGMLYLRRQRATGALSRRLAKLDGGDTAAKAEPLLRIAEASMPTRREAKPRLNLKRLHLQSGLSMPIWQLVAIAIAAATALVSLTLWLAFVPVVQAPIAGVLSLFILRWLLLRARKKRCDQFIEQLPDALDVATRSLLAGHPFVTSLGLVAEEMPEPVATEFQLLSEQLAYGVPMDDALDQLMTRVPAEDLHYLAMALSIHGQSGGNLTHTLRTLSDLIRGRFQLRAKIRALSSESRFTAKIMTVFPVLLYFALDLIAPDYFVDLWATGYGVHFVAFCTVMTLLGNYVVTKMIEIEV